MTNVHTLKKSANLSINLSQTLEESSKELIHQSNEAQWLQDNRAAIEEYNKYVEQNGLFNDRVRLF